MLLTGLSWIWIALSVFCTGYALTHLLNKVFHYPNKDLDTILIMGICFLTVYAQFFSLIYKVGAIASVLLLCIIGVILFFMRKSILQYFNQLYHTTRTESQRLLYIILFLGLTGVLIILTSSDITHYDTYLYHAQSIRWIEEYGVVPGLGNLHNRFAYNSSEFCLQALFSLRFLFHQSMHSVNGFITLVLLCYGLFSMKFLRKKRFFTSDFLRIGLILFINVPDNYLKTSSPGSDLLALGLVYYILIKWVSLWEDKETHEAPYAYLSLLGVFAISVKLSAAMIVLLTLMPAISLIKRKKWKDILLYIFIGVIIILPFLIRNVIISGYLLYPYPELDLFHVDWKMPSYTLLFDRNEIKAWGWGLNNVYLFDTPFKEWFATWYSHLSRTMKQLFMLNLLATAIAIPYGIYKAFQKNGKYLWLIITVCSCFLLWFIGAPLPRYGSIYLTLMPLLVTGKIMAGLKIRQDTWPAIAIAAIAFISYHMYPIIHTGLISEWNYWKRSADYIQYECAEYELEGEPIYVPVSNDQAGYYAFPSTPYAARLNLIELRGTNISKGFRIRKEYQDAFITTHGNINEFNTFEQSHKN